MLAKDEPVVLEELGIARGPRSRWTSPRPTGPRPWSAPRRRTAPGSVLQPSGRLLARTPATDSRRACASPPPTSGTSPASPPRSAQRRDSWSPTRLRRRRVRPRPSSGPRARSMRSARAGIALAPQTRESSTWRSSRPASRRWRLSLAVDSGRVVAAVHTDLVEGNDAAGSEWMPAEPAPGYRGAGQRRLTRTGPSSSCRSPTRAIGRRWSRCRSSPSDGPFAPTKLQGPQIDTVLGAHREARPSITRQGREPRSTSRRPLR